MAKVEADNQRLKYQLQEQDATKERLISAGADYERKEEKYTHEIDRLSEKLSKLQMGEDQARQDKERCELEVMKLSRELERLQYQAQLREEGRGSSRDRRDHSRENRRGAEELEELQVKL